MMDFHLLTIFPELFASVLSTTMLQKGQERGALRFRLHNIRDFTTDKHRMTDDAPYGGGQGMVMKPEPIVATLESLDTFTPVPRKIMLSPQGRPFTQAVAQELAQLGSIALLCGRYEGIDERVREFVDEEISIGDFIVSGGEIAAIVVLDAVSRLIPGVLGCEQSAEVESFSEPLLEYPQYTRPPEFRGRQVPEILLSGDHAAIAKWRRQQALLRTAQRRPDLLDHAALSDSDRATLASMKARGDG